MKKEKVLVDIRITCEPPQIYWYYKRPTLEDEAQYYEKWVKEFSNFIRDHRSQDPVNLNVERIYKDICEFCEREWEEDIDGIPMCCRKAEEEWKDNHSNPPSEFPKIT